MLLAGYVLQCLYQDRHIGFVSQERQLTDGEDEEHIRCPTLITSATNGQNVYSFFMYYLCIFVVSLLLLSM